LVLVGSRVAAGRCVPRLLAAMSGQLDWRAETFYLATRYGRIQRQIPAP
jgi:hypothetical protein